jgi:hypothetical protein
MTDQDQHPAPARTIMTTRRRAAAGRAWPLPRSARTSGRRYSCVVLPKSPLIEIKRGSAALRRDGASRATLWPPAPLARARRAGSHQASRTRWLIPASEYPASTGTRRERFASLHDGLRPPSTEPGRESPVRGSYRGKGHQAWARRRLIDLVQRCICCWWTGVMQAIVLRGGKIQPPHAMYRA